LPEKDRWVLDRIHSRLTVTKKEQLMTLRKIGINELSQEVRSFLAQVRPGESILVEDEAGRAQFGVIPYIEASAEARASAWRRLERLQQKTSKSMKAQGVTEADVEKLLMQDD
jgi:hypothetical protein